MSLKKHKLCQGCSKLFFGLPSAKFCSPECGRLYYDRMQPKSDFRGKDTTLKGAANELLVCHRLMQYGLACYRPCSPADLNDIVVIQDGVITIQVRTYRVDHKLNISPVIPKKESGVYDLWAFVTDPGGVVKWIPDSDLGLTFLITNGIS